MKDGFFLMHRGWRDNPIFKGEYSRGDAWVWLIENACWQPSRTRIKGDAVELQRGELTFSQRFLAEKWGWSKSRVDRFIADLRDEGMIETRSKIGATKSHAAGQGQAVINICNYEKYQNVKDGSRGNDLDGARGNSGATAGQQRGKEEQRNKGTKEEANASSVGAGENEKPKPAPKSKRSVGADHLLPDDWSPTLTPAALDRIAKWPPGMLEREEYTFRNHAASKGRLAKDWDAAFRMWLGKADERMIQNGNQRQNTSRVPSGIGVGPDRRTGFEKAADRRGYGAGPEQTSSEAGRSDLGDIGGGGEFPFASPHSLP